MRRKGGFTLPEMIVVLLIISILLGMAVPSMMDMWHQVQLDSAIQQLHRDIRWAQREAMRAQHEIMITFYMSKQPYTYTVRYTGNPENLRRRELNIVLSEMEAQRITISDERSFSKNGHILMKKGEHERYVYYYQSGRTRITKAPAQI